MLIPWNAIPGLSDAIKRENGVRDAAFLDEVQTDICGVKIRQMTPRDLLILDGIGNPLVCGGMPTAPALAEFLWMLSPQFKLNAGMRRFLFGRSCRKINYVTGVNACRKYIEDTFQDSPGSSGRLEGTPYAGWCSHLVFTIASTFGWSEREILNTPLKRLFQYLKVIRRSKDPECPMHNPSDKVKGDYVRTLHARQHLVNLLAKRCRN